jgi:uncharacterized protein (TIGR00297 family)
MLGSGFGGAVAGTVVGGAVFAGGGVRGGAALVVFFVSSTLLGRLRHGAGIEQRRGNARDAVQVLANGGVPALLALAGSAAPVHFRSMLGSGFGGAVAAATADTWATEIGSRSGQTPRSIASWRPVVPGASGGVTAAGLTASALGAATIAGVLCAGRSGLPRENASLVGATLIGGVAGSAIDSLLGATMQEVRFCDVCAKETELPVHGCGTATRRIRGAAWCDNDAVNAIATASGAGVAMIVTWALAERGQFSASGNQRARR